MNPRNSNQVSEANALRYISSTVLEPFGYTGIPSLHMQSTRYTVCNAVQEYARSMGAMKPWYHHHNVIREVRHIAKINGATNIRCKLHSSNADRRIFDLEFEMNNIAGKVFFGFAF